MILFKDLINIGHFNNNIFKPELIIQMKDKKYLNYIINQIRQFQFQGFTNSIIFDKNNKSYISKDKINELTNKLIRMIPLEYLSMIKNKNIKHSFNNE